MATQYWLFKSEPDVFSIDHLYACEDRTEPWDGVRNYQARNFMRDAMKVGDLALFYHSNCKEPGVAGLARISREAHPDHTAWDKKSKYYDPKASPENPRWCMVSLTWVETFKQVVTLNEMREKPQLQDMRILQKGNRLSITPVTEAEYVFISELGRGA